MIKRVLGAALLLLSSLTPLSAQSTLSSKEMIAISPVVCEELAVDSYSRRLLGMKLSQIVTANGFSSSADRYALVPNVVVLDKQVTATAPAMFSVELELSLYVVDVVEKVTIAETSLTLKGLDKTESKAISSALRRIIPRSPQLQVFMDKARTSILDYYATRTIALLKSADALATQEKYDEALAVLAPIPEGVDEYEAVCEAKVAIYNMKKERATAAANDEKRAELEAEKARLEAEIAKAKAQTAQQEANARQAEAEAETAKAAAEAAKAAAEAQKGSFERFTEGVNEWFSQMFN